MSKELDRDGRAVLVLANEARRMRDAAERVQLVVDAMALRRGIRLAREELEPSAAGEW